MTPGGSGLGSSYRKHPLEPVGVGIKCTIFILHCPAFKKAEPKVVASSYYFGI